MRAARLLWLAMCAAMLRKKPGRGLGFALNAIAPGATLTPLLQAGLDSDEFGPMIKAFPVPTGGFGTPQQIAAWIGHMMGEDADFLCGSVIFVDGGTDALVRPDSWPDTYEIPAAV